MANGKSCSSSPTAPLQTSSSSSSSGTENELQSSPHQPSSDEWQRHFPSLNQWIVHRNVTTKYKSLFCCTSDSLQLLLSSSRLSNFGPILGNIYIRHRFKSVNCAMMIVMMKVQGRGGKNVICLPGYSKLFLHPTQGLTEERRGVLILLSAGCMSCVNVLYLSPCASLSQPVSQSWGMRSLSHRHSAALAWN